MRPLSWVNAVAILLAILYDDDFDGKVDRREEIPGARAVAGLGGLLGAMAAIEQRFLRRFSLPFGLSAIVIARRPR